MPISADSCCHSAWLGARIWAPVPETLADFSPQSRQARTLPPVFGGSQVVIETAPPGDQITSTDRRRVRAYFNARGPDYVNRVLWYGVPAEVLLGVATFMGLPFPAVGWLAIVAMLVFMATAYLEVYEKKREKLVDEVAKSDFDRAQVLALERSQLKPTELRDPKCCAFLGVRLDKSEDYGAAFVSTKLGRDERTRWTPHEITSVYIGLEYLWIHYCAIDLTTGAALYERSRPVFYSDVVSVVLDSKTQTFPMPPRLSKRVKASKYWGARGGVVLEESLQFDGKQKLSLALRSGEMLVLASWDGARDKGQPADAVQNKASAFRLRGWVEQSKRTHSPSAPAATPHIVTTRGLV